MWQSRSRLVVLLVGLLAVFCSGRAAAAGFNNGSLQGTYVFVARGLSNGLPNTAPLVPTSYFGKAVFNGNGTCSISQGLYNLDAGLNGGFIAPLQSASQGCTYSVNADGTGTVNLAFLNNLPSLSLSIFVVDNGNEVMFSMQTFGQMTNGESFFRKQVNQAQNYSNASLNGGWVWEGKGVAGPAGSAFFPLIPQEATALFLFDGAGHCTLTGIQNINAGIPPGATLPLNSAPNGCTYSVNADGTGIVNISLTPAIQGGFALSFMFARDTELQCETGTVGAIASDKCWVRKQVNPDQQ